LILDQFEELEAHAQRLQKHPRTLLRWMNQPDGLPHTYAGRTPLFSPAWTKEWLECRRVHRNPAPKRGRAA
jgi:hypothetical protein